MLRTAIGAAIARTSCKVDVEAELGGDDNLVADRRGRLADQFLIDERTIGFGRVEEGNAAIMSGADQFDHLLFVCRRAVGRTHATLRVVRVRRRRPNRSSRLRASDGKLHGGSSAFAYVGSYQQAGHTIAGVVTTTQHTDDPNHPSVFGINNVRINFQGVEKNGFASVEGTAAEAPALVFKALLTRIGD